MSEKKSYFSGLIAAIIGAFPAGFLAGYLAMQSGCTPTPVPPPPPTPPPAPVQKGDWLVFVRSPAAPTAEEAAVIFDQKLREEIGASELRVRVEEASSPDIVGTKLLEAVNKVGLPAMAVVHADGSIARSAKLSLNVADVRAFALQGRVANPMLARAASGLATAFANGEFRVLGALQAKQSDRAGFKSFSATYANVPRDKWREVDYSWAVPSIYNQGNQGSCVGHGAAAGYATARKLGGYGNERLSATFVYSLINGGQDNGAIVSHAMGVLKNVGTCLETTVGPGKIYPPHPPHAKAEAARFKAEGIYAVNTFDEMVSGLQYGFIPVFGIDIGQNFSPNREGILPEYRPGGGGHCMYAVGYKKINDKPYLIVVNSWGRGWGAGGICYMPESYFSKQAWDIDAFNVRVSITDPNGVNPVLK